MKTNRFVQNKFIDIFIRNTLHVMDYFTFIFDEMFILAHNKKKKKIWI